MRSHRARAGFTLIEILVVITIVGIVVSVAVLSLGTVSGDKELERETQRLTALLELARDESLLQGREYGLQFATTMYRFVELNPLTRQWEAVVGDDALNLRELPENIELELFIEDQRLELDPVLLDAAVSDDEEDDDEGTEFYRPQVFIFSSGDVTPFEIELREIGRGDSMRLAGDLFGRVSIVEEEAF